MGAAEVVPVHVPVAVCPALSVTWTVNVYCVAGSKSEKVYELPAWAPLYPSLPFLKLYVDIAVDPATAVAFTVIFS